MLPKERTAWAWFICLLIVPTTYFVFISNLHSVNEGLDLERLKSLSVALMAMALVAVSIRIYNYKLRSQEGSPSIDERDHLIEQTGVSKAYPILIAGMILVGFVMPFNSGKWQIVDTAFFSIVLAELVHYGFVLRSYRAEDNA